MAPRKSVGENSKKAAGQARKAEAAAAKQAEKDRQKAAVEDAKWQQGAKSNAKAEAAAQKATEAARKKAEREALLAAEEATQPSKGKGAGTKTAQKKQRGTPSSSGLDDALSALDGPLGPRKAASINASGIDNALDALSLDSKSNDQIDRHPERRFKAAYTIYEERRLEEMKDDKTLRRQQKIEQIRKEFEKHPDNPFNQVAGKYNSTREELREIAEAEKVKTEARLASPS